MSILTSPISTASTYGPRYRSRKAERRMLARRLRLRDRRRKFNELQYRFRHATSILATGFLASVALVVAKGLGWI
jgi:hypothetical protein